MFDSHVSQRALRDGQRDPGHDPTRFSGRIVFADDLTPADTVQMQHDGILAFLTEFGGPNSHTAILARSLRIPAVAGLHSGPRFLRDGDQVIVDGRALAQMEAADYHDYKRVAMAAVLAAWQRLCARHDCVVVEG